MKSIFKSTILGAAALVAATTAGAQTLSPGFPSGTYLRDGFGTGFVEASPITSLTNITAYYMAGPGCEINASSSSSSAAGPNMDQFFLEDPNNSSNGIWYRNSGVVEAGARVPDGQTFTFPISYTSSLSARYQSNVKLDGNLIHGTAVATQTITITEAEVRAVASSDFIANCMSGSSSSSSTPVTDSTPATASASIIQSDISRVTRSTVTANNSMMSQGLERFIRDRETGVSLAEAIVTRGNNGLALSPSFDASGNTLFGGLSFLDQSVSASGVYSKLSYGEFDVQDEVGAGTTVSFNGRMVWERAAGEDAMIGYFLGAALNQSNIEGSYTGDQTRYGLTGGMHGFKALNDNLYLSGYGSLGIARSSLDITDGASSDVTGDYVSRTLSLGGQVSGSVEYETYELRPSVSLNYVRTWVGDITLDNSGTPMDVDVGNTSFVELMAKPEFLFPMEQQAGSNMATTASVSPRLICERNTAAGITTNQCGAGLGLGVNATSEDGATNLSASISFDRVGGAQRRGLNVQAEFRF